MNLLTVPRRIVFRIRAGQANTDHAGDADKVGYYHGDNRAANGVRWMGEFLAARGPIVTMVVSAIIRGISDVRVRLIRVIEASE